MSSEQSITTQKIDKTTLALAGASVICILAIVVFLLVKAFTVLGGRMVSAEDVRSFSETLMRDSLKPVGSVNIGTIKAAPSAAKSPEEIFKSVCTACHTEGVAGAPKVTDTTEWQKRLDERHLDGLYNSALHGFKGMLPKGGASNLSDDEVKATVQYMLKTAKINLEVGADKNSKPAEKQEPVSKDAAPKTSDVANVVMAQPSTQQEPPKEVNNAQALVFDVVKGKETYASLCVACHETGIANAPAITNNAEWGKRFAEKGFKGLFNSGINGFNTMQPRGGNPNLSDEEIRNAIAYMLNTAGVKY